MTACTAPLLMSDGPREPRGPHPLSGLAVLIALACAALSGLLVLIALFLGW